MSKKIKIEHFTLKDQFDYIFNQLDDLGKAYLQLWIEFILDQSKILIKLGINEMDFTELMEGI